MCCRSKKKQVTQSNQVAESITQPVKIQAYTPNPQLTNPTFISNVKTSVPKSAMVFSGNDLTAAPLNNQSNFVNTQKSTVFAQDRGDRMQDYATQLNQAQASKLIQPKQLLTYDLDANNGVSFTPVINTFDYKSQLSHCLSRNYIEQQNQKVQSRISSNSFVNKPTQISQNGYRMTESRYEDQEKTNLNEQHYEINNPNNSTIIRSNQGQQFTYNSGIRGVADQESRVTYNSKGA